MTGREFATIILLCLIAWFAVTLYIETRPKRKATGKAVDEHITRNPRN